MFNKQKTTPAPKQNGSATIITAGTVFHGDFNSENDLRIDGIIYGNISSKAKIVIGPTGFIEGNIEGMHADIAGKVVGNITASDAIKLQEKSHVQGNIKANTFQADYGAVFNGQCQVGGIGNVVLMKETDVLTKAK